MATTRAFNVAKINPEHGPGLAALFASNGYGCYCRFWHFGGNAREWLARCAQSPEENAAEMLSCVSRGSGEMLGMVASLAENARTESAGTVVGWLKVAPATALSKLYDQRLYKGLPIFGGDRSGTFAVGCLFVREDLRRHGVARALLAGAIEAAPSWGAQTLEAFPRSDTDVPGSALMTGPSRLFLDAGFRVIHDFFPYPVLRLELGRQP